MFAYQINFLKTFLQNPLNYLIWLPIASALVGALLRSERAHRAMTWAVLLLEAGIFSYIAARFDYASKAFQFGYVFPWIPDSAVSYAVGIDGVSLALIGLTLVLYFVVLGVSPHFVKTEERTYRTLLLVLLTSLIGIFSSLDFILFYVFWELMLIPMYFLIAIWGEKRAKEAALKFFLFTFGGSLLMLAGGFVVFFAGYSKGFDLLNLSIASLSMNPSMRAAAFVLLTIGFMVKIPIFPLHTWLPDAHSEAPTPVSMLLAGVLLKTGVFGLYRIVLPLAPAEAKTVGVIFAALATVNIFYGSLVTLSQKDLKRLIAYASVSHMGYATLGLFTLNSFGVSGGLFQLISHGFISALLFLIAGGVALACGTRDIGKLRRLRVLPVLTFAAFVGFAGNSAMAGTSGLWGELMAIYGTIRANHWTVYNSVNGFHLLLIFAIAGSIVTAGYSFWVLYKVFISEEGLEGDEEISPSPLPREVKTGLVVLSVFVLLLGFFPNIVFGSIDNYVEALLKSVSLFAGEL